MTRLSFGCQRIGHHLGIRPIDGGIVIAAEQEHGTAHLISVQLQRQGIPHHGIVLAALAHEPTTGTLVHVWIAHGDHRIDGGHEIGRCAVGQEHRPAHHQMSAGGETHRTHRRVALRFNGF